MASHFLGIADIGCRNLLNSFRIHILEGYPGIECNRCHNCHLTPCIQTFNVCGGVCFCIAQFRSHCQRICKFHAIFGHFSQYKISGAVYDFRQMISSQTLLQRPYDRNSTRNCRFKQEILLIERCHIQQLFSINSNQILVGCYYIFPCRKGLHHISFGGFHPSHYFNDDFNLPILNDFVPVIRKN